MTAKTVAEMRAEMPADSGKFLNRRTLQTDFRLLDRELVEGATFLMSAAVRV